jgi:nitrate/TMAO reductase-like tetraheme cytochrome c subunit
MAGAPLAASAGKVRFKRTRKAFAKVPHPPKGSKRFIALTIVSTAFVVGGIVGGVMWFIPYSESVSFCTTCHTMIPQHKSFDVSAHGDVACGECHVAPGVVGWVKAKMAGTQELKALILNNYPTPIPPIPHEDLPPTNVTCMKCHSLERINTPGNPIKLILRPRYETDKANTMQQVAVAIRPTGLGSSRSADNGTSTVDASSGEQDVLDPRGVHWHVAVPVAVYSTDETYQTIPLVEYKNESGQTESFIQASEIGLPSNVAPDIDRVKAQSVQHTMDCIDCHNMVGHNIPDPSRALDQSMSEGTISPSLPYIKRDALALLNQTYESDEQGAIAIEAFGNDYAKRNPSVAAENPQAITDATKEIGKIFTVTTTPAMKTVWDSYPDNLGHQRSPGCFRCHDGAHVKVIGGQATDQVIPSTCSTCHTFPQVGTTVSGLQLGVPPASHADKLYVFSHKNDVTSVDAAFSPASPTDASCSTCHQRTYCENCHNSGAVKVTHDEMLYNHAESVKKSSMGACAYCHQPVYCATCHSTDFTDQMTTPKITYDANSSEEQSPAAAPEPTPTSHGGPLGNAEGTSTVAAGVATSPSTLN